MLDRNGQAEVLTSKGSHKVTWLLQCAKRSRQLLYLQALPGSLGMDLLSGRTAAAQCLLSSPLVCDLPVRLAGRQAHAPQLLDLHTQ